jgi:hypothetical protein
LEEGASIAVAFTDTNRGVKVLAPLAVVPSNTVPGTVRLTFLAENMQSCRLEKQPDTDCGI